MRVSLFASVAPKNPFPADYLALLGSFSEESRPEQAPSAISLTATSLDQPHLRAAADRFKSAVEIGWGPPLTALVTARSAVTFVTV